MKAMVLRLAASAIAVCTFGSVFVPNPASARAAEVEYDLTIAQQDVNITGKPARAMTINGRVPGPVLRFTEGDLARIRVHNKMTKDTSIHWHGLLVPPGMDGVPLVSFPPIAPDATFTYEFPIRQSGTYWYHSHTRLQEQSGVYGSIVITPKEPESRAEREYVVLFSDWTDEDPDEVLRTLKRGSDWYAVEKGSAQSILGAARLNLLGAYLGRELSRMPPMDIADVAYDRFLANGAPETHLPADAGETIRLRIINGSATTYFHLGFAGGPLTIISADGQPVEATEVQRLLIAVAETYDVLVTLPASQAYEFRATAHDGSGYASVWIGNGQRHPAPDVPKPNLYHSMGGLAARSIFSLTPAGSMGMSDGEVETGNFDQPGMKGMGSMGMEPGPMHEMDGGSKTPTMPRGHGGHGPGPSREAHDPGPLSKKSTHAEMQSEQGGHTDEGRHGTGRKHGWMTRLLAADVSASESLAMDGTDSRRPWPPYVKLRAAKRTALPADKPVREVRLTLDGDMERYVWFLNNRPLSESDSIRIREGEVVRFIMINRTMMHHPMHLHGHFFRVINGQGDYSPLKHTVDVAPMSTTVIELHANEVGDWFFHCHLLYHMKSGMARVVHYEDYTLEPELAAIRPAFYRDSWYAWGQADALSNLTEGFVTASNTRNIFSAGWEVGWQGVEETEWEALITWERYVNRFFTFFVGADIGDAIEEDRGIAGIRYLLPFNLETHAFIGTDGGVRAEVIKDFQLTPRLVLENLIQYDTDTYWEYVGGISYLLSRSLSLRLQWHSDYGWGAGVQLRF